VATYTLLPREKPPQRDSTAGQSLPGGKRPGAFDIDTYVEYFRRPKLASLYVQFFLFTFAFSCFTSGFALFAERRFTVDGHPWTQKEVGYLFAYAGLLGILLQGGAMRRLVKRFGEIKLTLAGFASAVVAYLLLGWAYTLAMLLIAATISSFGNGVVRPALTALITHSVGRHEQGVAIGISGSLSSLAMSLAPPSGGAMLDGNHTIAWALIPATVMLLGFIVASVTKVSSPRPEPEPTA
jgi:MFS family permease